ncbi:MAG: c-type cytochrome [Cytophagales bacterium]|nr:c-type cytochrome [Bernardetiaceae bacterium]MDW8211388.1 c-type cytochrome [Cytophagales bacterium]
MENNNWLYQWSRVTYQLTVVIIAALILLLVQVWYVANPPVEQQDFSNHPFVKATQEATKSLQASLAPSPILWKGPDPSTIPNNPSGDSIRYGRELIANTAAYFGPKGSIAQTTNGMNCQNCHLEAGTRPWGNNYGAVWSTYPKFRARSGTVESIEKRINDCFERSLNGKPLPEDSKEMKSIIAYMRWLGQGVAKGQAPAGSGIMDLPYLDRPADPEAGKVLYEQKCVACHKKDGQGQLAPDGKTYIYPPLWGEHSYNVSAGLYRLSRLAGYLKANMPLGATWEKPQLTDEEAWDIAAYVNSMPRPNKRFPADWPDISKKPVDHPFGPFADPYSEKQHKYGPFRPIKKWYEQQAQAKATK